MNRKSREVAYHILLTGYETRQYAHVEWEENGEVFAGEINFPYASLGHEVIGYNRPQLDVNEVINEECIQTPASLQKQEEMREDFKKEIEVRERNYEDIRQTEEWLNDWLTHSKIRIISF